jgi:hypothetical protein
VTRNWLFARLLKPIWMDHEDNPMRGLSVMVSALVEHLRSVDAESLWAFQRLDDHFGPNLGLWLYSRSDVLCELDRRLQVEAVKHDWPIVSEDYEPQVSKYLSSQALEVAAALSSASSDFALDLLHDGELLGDVKLATAVLHLGQLVELIPDRDRAAFLFHCWQYRTTGLLPSKRIELAIQAERQNEKILRTAADIRWDRTLIDSWEHYMKAIRAIIMDHSSNTGAPASYLLFDNAHLTHKRLGIGVAVEALAARIVRGALTAGRSVPRPLIPALKSVCLDPPLPSQRITYLCRRDRPKHATSVGIYACDCYKGEMSM